MIEAVRLLQALAGLLWILPAAMLAPRIVASWRKSATRTEILSAPIGFFALLQVGFSARWWLWPDAVRVMDDAELVTWASLYSLSAFCALWVFAGARQTRGL